MAFENREGGKYFTVLGGKFAVRVAHDTPGSVRRVNKVGKEVSEIFHDSFTGKLINIRTKEGEYGKSWEFDFKDGNEVYTLQLSYSNSYATTILKILPNVDLTQEIKMQPDQKVIDGKTKSSLFISQNGVTLKHAYTKDAPNGLPPMTQVTVKGNLVWDDTDQLAFLKAMVRSDILPKLEGTPAPEVKDPLASEFADENPLGATGSDEDDF